MSPALRTVFVVFKTHFDIGFTGLVEEVLSSVTDRMIPQAMEACRLSAELGPGHRYTWTLPAWPLSESLRRLEGTPRAEELARLVAEGRIAWHSLPFTTHTELFGLEDLVRGLLVARRLGDRFGRSSISAKMTDVPGHTWILPSLLAGAGVSFLHLGCNACSTPPDVPLLFDWEGPDGARVTTMYSPGGYGTSLLPPDGWELPVWLALQHTLDNAGPQRAEVIPSILDEVARRSPGTEVRVGSLDDFAAALAEIRPRLPVVRKDLGDSWIHGAASMPRALSAARELRGRLVALESARALLGAGRGSATGAHRARVADTAASAAIADAYEALLLFGEHTWGMDTKLALNPPEFGGRVYEKPRFRSVRESGRYDRIQQSWRDKAGLVDRTAAVVAQLAAGDAAEGGVPSLPVSFDVVNHQPWTWKGLVRVGPFEGRVTVTREPGGGALETTLRDGVLWARVDGIPPLGAARIRVQRTAAPPSTASARHPVARKDIGHCILDNGTIRVVVDEADGSVTSLVHIPRHREWVDRRAGIPFGMYRYDVYSRREIVRYLKSYAYDLEPWFLADFGRPGYPEVPHRTFSAPGDGARAENGPGWGRITTSLPQAPESVEDMGNPSLVTRTITLRENEPWVELEYRLTGKDESPLLEAGHVLFPFSARRPRYAINKTGTVVDPATDIARGANRLLHACERWVDVQDGRAGMLVIPLDSPLFSIGSMAIERFDPDAQPGDPVLHFNLFNTQWGTNFPQWIGGDLRFRFRLVPHAGDWRDARAWVTAAAAFSPPEGIAEDGARPAPSAEGILMEPLDDLETVVIKRPEHGEGVIFRFRDPTGRGGRRTLRLRVPLTTRPPAAVLCSLTERELRPIPLTAIPGGASLTLDLRPFEIVTLKLVL